MADLGTLNGVSDARNDLYNRLERGEIAEARALAQERILRGQVELKANVPIRLLGLIFKSKSRNMETYGVSLMQALHKFTTGTELPLPAITEHKG